MGPLRSKIAPSVSFMIPADIKRKISQRIYQNLLMNCTKLTVFFARKCFNLLASKHAQRGPAEVHASLPLVNI